MPKAKRSPRTSSPRKTDKPTPAAPPAAHVTDYTVGDHVSHPIFGDGIVAEINQNKLTIEFPKSVTKQIIDGYVKHRRP
jgi:hypothetical protein